MFKNLEEVFTLEKIESIRNNVRKVMKDRYGDSIERAEIAIGNFYNGVALIYIGHSQQHIEHVYGLETYATAQLAINPNGEFIKFKLKKNQEYFGFETYNSESDSTLICFNLRRAKDVIGKDTITTDDYSSWQFSRDKYKLANGIFCYCQVKKGKLYPHIEPIQEFIVNEEEDYDEYYDEYEFYGDYDENEIEDINENENKKILSATFFFRCWGISRAVLRPIKLDTNKNTLFIIQDRYILLCDNMQNYMPVENSGFIPDKYSYSYYNLFARYNIGSTDILENRYGVFDLSLKKTIIHVGEMGYTEALISGFTRLDFTTYQGILTFDFFDRKANKGISYNKELTYKTLYITDFYCKSATNIITDYWHDEKSRTGKNAGEWYIIREGKNAGRTLCWLLANDKIKDVVYMIKTFYLSFNNFRFFTYPTTIDKKQRNKIWVALDSNKRFKDVKSPDDVLQLTEPFSSKYITKHQSLIDFIGQEEPNFEQLVEDDTDYLVGLIDGHCLLIDENVLDELEKSYEGNNSYLKKLFKVKEANDRYIEDINEYEEWCLQELRARQEEDDTRYWADEGYRLAFEDDPDAEWNID